MKKAAGSLHPTARLKRWMRYPANINGGLLSKKSAECKMDTRMLEYDDLYGNVSFGGGGGGGGGGGSDSRSRGGHGAMGHNTGVSHSANPSTAYGGSAGLHSAGVAEGQFGDINGNGSNVDEVGLGLAAVSTLGSGAVATAAGVVELGMAAAAFGGGYVDHGR